MAQVWYPAIQPRHTKPVSYLAHREILEVVGRFFHVPAFLLGNVAQAPTHAFAGAAPLRGRFPVLLNPTGFSGFRDASLFWIEELVSHGYVVVGLDQPGTAAATVFPDGRVISVLLPKTLFDQHMPLALSQTEKVSTVMNGVELLGGIVPFLAADLSFALSQMSNLDQHDPLLAGHLDTDRAGVFGMSLGGYQGPEACRVDLRFKACLAVDAGQTTAVVRAGLTQPVMVMSRDAWVMREERSKAGGWPEAEIAHTVRDEAALYLQSHADAYFLTMNTMYHVNWTDVPIWSPVVRWLGLAGPVNPYRGFAATNAYTLAFFDRYLKGQASALLTGDSALWPEVTLRHRP